MFEVLSEYCIKGSLFDIIKRMYVKSRAAEVFMKLSKIDRNG